MNKKEIEDQKYHEMIYDIAERCVKDSDGWMLVSDFVPIAQKAYHIDFSRCGGPNKFLQKYYNIVEVKEQQNTSAGGKTSFFRVKTKRAKKMRKSRKLILIISVLGFISFFLLFILTKDQFILKILLGLGTVSSIFGILLPSLGFFRERRG